MKELREQAEMAEQAAELREAEQRARADSLQAKVAEQVPDVSCFTIFSKYVSTLNIESGVSKIINDICREYSCIVTSGEM